jgi:hypothetical protein
MRINSITPANIATNVWAAATRTLTVDPATDAGAATLVWTHSPRTLTTSAITFTAFGSSSSAATATLVDLRPASNHFRLLSVNFVTGTTNVEYGMYDGATFNSPGPGAATQDIITAFGNSAQGPAIRQGSGSSKNYVYGGFDLS